VKSTPEHVAIIMDGNGRWAKKFYKPRIFGHREGIKTVKRIVEYAGRIGIKYLTLYTFSTENWKRPHKEVEALMKLLYDKLISEIDELKKNNVVLHTIGDISMLPDYVQRELNNAKEKLKDNTGLNLILALNYGSRDEIRRAIIKIANDIKENKIDVNDITTELISSYLDTADFPDPDLIIRTSGEMRLSNFLLYQSAYSEIYVTKTLWPDFDEQEFQHAIDSYTTRERRFGGIK